MCCKLHSIKKVTDNSGDTDFPFDKQANTWCKHFAPGRGCAIFDSPELPNLCRNYLCLWKFAGDDPPLPEDCRPDKLHAIITSDSHPDFPGQIVLRVTLANRGLGPKLTRLLETLQRGVSLLIAGEPGLILSDNLELARALAAREKAERT